MFRRTLAALALIASPLAAQDMTDAERKLWSLLRQRPDGLKFRHQHPIGPYVADFACPGNPQQ